jgi:hypothetical protein
MTMYATPHSAVPRCAAVAERRRAL